MTDCLYVKVILVMSYYPGKKNVITVKLLNLETPDIPTACLPHYIVHQIHPPPPF